MPEPQPSLRIWDGEMDFGSWDGTFAADTYDTDDPNSPDLPPFMEGVGTDVEPQGAMGIGRPPDDMRSPLFRRRTNTVTNGVGVRYELIYHGPEGITTTAGTPLIP